MYCELTDKMSTELRQQRQATVGRVSPVETPKQRFYLIRICLDWYEKDDIVPPH